MSTPIVTANLPSTESDRPVLILGAGINGAAVARDLALNGVPVVIVDRHDIAFGATSRSSRLIHGGLRYLEYRDIALVKESLQERERLCALAPQFVKPLRLVVPVEHHFGGLKSGAVKFLGAVGSWWGSRLIGRATKRGLIAIRFGLSLYDWLAGESALPSHAVMSARSADSVTGLASRFRWVCEFSDAQMTYPERFVLALLNDARNAALSNGSRFDVRTHCEVTRCGPEFRLHRLSEQLPSSNAMAVLDEILTPSLIVNATGAWGDSTLRGLQINERSLFAGTQGSHLFTRCERLRAALRGRGIYCEANDGRLVFILPCAGGVLIGTTDDPFSGDPSEATANERDLNYLVELVNGVFPDVHLRGDEIDMRQAGVRPLPNVTSQLTAAIPRGHAIHSSEVDGVPVLTLIGGKLTTCRALATEVTDLVLRQRNVKRRASTELLPISGAPTAAGSASPRDPSFANWLDETARSNGLTLEQAQSVYELIGDRFADVFSSASTVCDDGGRHSIPGTAIPRAFVRWSLKSEWCETLSDLVERRLMLIFQPLRTDTLRSLSDELVTCGKLKAENVDIVIAELCERLRSHYGICVTT